MVYIVLLYELGWNILFAWFEQTWIYIHFENFQKYYNEKLM